MPLDAQFFQIAQTSFNPHNPDSGTEHMAPLLYSLIRMVRPRTVVEFGSGYTTLFTLRALADNADDVRAERQLLREKTLAVAGGTLSTMLTEDGKPHPVAMQWYSSGGKACAVDPGYYLDAYEPRLFSFERQPHDHPYVQAMRDAVEQLELQRLFEPFYGAQFSAKALPQGALPVDLAWNDDNAYREFFEEFWEVLNPRGGLLIFHNVPASDEWWYAIEWMKEQRAAAKDLEVLILQEPHKLNQNGCAILRRVSEYRPPFALSNPPAIIERLSQFMSR
uniref:Methyltransferase n=1 Tax=Jahnella sp. MSr9139 TaxID=1434086 RepID=V5UVU0_9BACT|nr:methyltransferase [Jahnella sp. MSr9139]